MTLDFHRPINTTQMIKLKDDVALRVRAIRAYKTSPNGWAIQVRGPSTLANGRAGKDFLAAHAALTMEDLVAFRDALNALIDAR